MRDDIINITSVKLIYFSPTQTTKNVVEGIAEAIPVNKIEHLDLTSPESWTRKYGDLNDELAIIGTPVYWGRVPFEAAKRLRRLKANNTPAVVVVVYGNNEYKDALLELNNLAIEVGFKPVAAGVFIGEHLTLSIARGRPDAEDLEKASEFGRKIWEYLTDIGGLGDIKQLQIPGNLPYIEPEIDKFVIYPVSRETKCLKCETCVTGCPMAAIRITDTVITDKDTCIICGKCVKNCPSQARVWNTSWVLKIVIKLLNKRLSKRKEPEVFYADKGMSK